MPVVSYSTLVSLERSDAMTNGIIIHLYVFSPEYENRAKMAITISLIAQNNKRAIVTIESLYL